MTIVFCLLTFFVWVTMGGFLEHHCIIQSPSGWAFYGFIFGVMEVALVFKLNQTPNF